MHLQIYVTVSGKTGLIAHLKVSRTLVLNIQSVVAGQWVVAMHTKFSYILQQFPDHPLK